MQLITIFPHHYMGHSPNTDVSLTQGPAFPLPYALSHRPVKRQAKHQGRPIINKEYRFLFFNQISFFLFYRNNVRLLVIVHAYLNAYNEYH